MKTNATRILERLGINFEIREYVVDPNDTGVLCWSTDFCAERFRADWGP